MYDGPGTGTMGLWDNLEALRWIYAHIENFGGDPESVCYISILAVISRSLKGLELRFSSISPYMAETSPFSLIIFILEGEGSIGWPD